MHIIGTRKMPLYKNDKAGISHTTPFKVGHKVRRPHPQSLCVGASWVPDNFGKPTVT